MIVGVGLRPVEFRTRRTARSGRASCPADCVRALATSSIAASAMSRSSCFDRRLAGGERRQRSSAALRTGRLGSYRIAVVIVGVGEHRLRPAAPPPLKPLPLPRQIQARRRLRERVERAEAGFLEDHFGQAGSCRKKLRFSTRSGRHRRAAPAGRRRRTAPPSAGRWARLPGSPTSGRCRAARRFPRSGFRRTSNRPAPGSARTGFRAVPGTGRFRRARRACPRPPAWARAAVRVPSPASRFPGDDVSRRPARPSAKVVPHTCSRAVVDRPPKNASKPLIRSALVSIR